MRPIRMSMLSTVSSLLLVSATPAQLTSSEYRLAPTAATPGGCEIYYSLQPIDPAVPKLLGTPTVPTDSNLFSSPEYIQQRDWDFPSKVTPWIQRPKPEEIARRREELA